MEQKTTEKKGYGKDKKMEETKVCEKKLWIIIHEYDVDGGEGEAVRVSSIVGVVSATEEDISAFLNEWDKPRIYDRPYNNLWEHHISAIPVEDYMKDISKLEPYDPMTKNWPDIPEEIGINFEYNEATHKWTHRVFDTTIGEFVTKTIKNEEDI